MAENQSDLEQDPTMEEILQSIKRIIAEDDEDGAVEPTDTPAEDDFQNVLDAVAEQMEEEEASVDAPESEPEAVPAVEEMPAVEDSPDIEPEPVVEDVAAEEPIELVEEESEISVEMDVPAEDDDVLELTEEMLDDVEPEIAPTTAKDEGEASADDIDALLADFDAAPLADDDNDAPDFSLDDLEFDVDDAELRPDESDESDEVPMEAVEEEPVDVVIEEDNKQFAPEVEESGPLEQHMPEPVEKPLEQESDSLLEDEVAASATASIAKLMEAKAAPKAVTGNMHTRAGTTVEELMVEAMKPMLKDWLNEHLPVVVEEVVKRELEKLMP